MERKGIVWGIQLCYQRKHDTIKKTPVKKVGLKEDFNLGISK
jgi:hypothetical protein